MPTVYSGAMVSKYQSTATSTHAAGDRWAVTQQSEGA